MYTAHFLCSISNPVSLTSYSSCCYCKWYCNQSFTQILSSVKQMLLAAPSFRLQTLASCLMQASALHLHKQNSLWGQQPLEQWISPSSFLPQGKQMVLRHKSLSFSVGPTGLSNQWPTHSLILVWILRLSLFYSHIPPSCSLG